MDIQAIAAKYAELYDSHDGSARHGYKVNAAYNRFMDALADQHEGDGRFTPPGKAEAERMAREMIGGE